MQTRILAVLVGIGGFFFVARGVAHAWRNSQNFTSAASGTSVTVPLDLDADSCTTSGKTTVCTDSSSYNNHAGSSKIFNSGDSSGFTGQSVIEDVPVPGTGCKILGQVQPIESCTLSNTSEQGCELKSAGGAEVDRGKSTGDLLFSTVSETVCIDLSSGPPFNFTAHDDVTFTGGTGRFAGVSGSGTVEAHGQELVADPAGHGFSWFVGNGSATMTTPGK